MTHRVLADFNCDATLLDGDAPRLVDDIRGLLAENGWETALGQQADIIFQQMADSLPDLDLPSFVRNTRIKMWRKAPHAELTLGYFVDSGVGKIRVRVRADNNAVIAELGKRTANQLLVRSELKLTHMDLFESRNGESLLQGGEFSSDAYKFWSRTNLQVSVPLAFAAALFVIGIALSIFAYHTRIGWTALGDPLWVWFGRLFGPLLMAIVTTGSIVARDRRPNERRSADWEI